MRKAWWGAMAAAAMFAMPAVAADAGNMDATAPVKDAEPRGSAVSLQADAGVGGFTGGLGNVTGVGPTWGVRAGKDVSRGFGGEIAYNGSRIPITDNRLQSGAAAYQTGLDVMAKAYVPFRSNFRPYAGVGVGENFLNMNDKADPLYNDDWVFSVPIAAGVQYDAGNFTAGARATWSLLGGEEFAKVAAPADNQGTMLQGSLNVGGRF